MKTVKKLLLIFSPFLVLVLFLGAFHLTRGSDLFSPPVTSPPASLPSSPEVLGSQSSLPAIFISGDGEGYAAGGLISLASTGEPAVSLSSGNFSGSVEIELYQANENLLLNYLIYDKEQNQISQAPDVSGLRLVQRFNQIVVSGYDQENKVVLPLEETGVWLLRVNVGGQHEDSFLIRSRTGVLVKEGDSEFVFWAQDFATQKSLSGGQVEIYSLRDGVNKLNQQSFDDRGLARAPVSAEADIALYRREGDLAVVPINLRYLNTSSIYRYQYFQLKEKNSRFFIFTDRPLYRPGDTVYFKVIARDEDDARYSLPSGQATVAVYDGGWWDEESRVFQNKYSYSDFGSFSGEYQIPADGKTGSYLLGVNAGDYRDEAFFEVTYFRKPEYTLEITPQSRELIAGEKALFTVSGRYFSGQPLFGEKAKYKVLASTFGEYEFFRQTRVFADNNYRWGNRGGKQVAEGEITFDKEGLAELSLETALAEPSGRTQIFSLEVEYGDASGNPVFDRKNFLVYAGDYRLYRQEESSFLARTGSLFELPLVLIPNRQLNPSGLILSARVIREYWVQTQNENSRYPSWRKEEQELPSLSAKADSSGKAVLQLTPSQPGSYKVMVEGRDARGNLIKKDFYFYASDQNSFYSDKEETELSIVSESQNLSPGEKAKLTISSASGQGEVFLSLERGRMDRFQIVSLTGKTTSVEVPLQESDLPNIFAHISGFANGFYQQDEAEVELSLDSKKLAVSLLPQKEKFAPGEEVELEVVTTSLDGQPQAAEVAVWAVDKAIFELSDSNLPQILNQFWYQRYNATETNHSLAGIVVLMAEGGGGCFTAETPVLMADGQTKAIGSLRAGDKVLTRKSPTDSRLVTAKVKNVSRKEVLGVLVINKTLKVAPEHRFWVGGAWKEAGSLQVGDFLLNTRGEEELVSSLEWVKGKFEVFNLEIVGLKTFFAGGVWVHNQKGGARSVFKDVAYWNPSVRTDSSGKAKVIFKLPDNLTTWVIAGVGATKETRVGQTEKEIFVSKKVVLRPILPNLLRVGDAVLLEAYLQNFTEATQTFKTDLQFDAGRVEATGEETIALAPGETKLLNWRIFPETAKESKLLFSAVSLDDQAVGDTVEQKLPVHLFGFWDSQVQVGRGEKEFSFRPSEGTDLSQAKINLSLAPTLLATLPEAMAYLSSYPHDCAEQTATKLINLSLAKINLDLFPHLLDDRKPDETAAKLLNRLNDLRRFDGGWGWWSGGFSDPLMTLQVTESLLFARQAGFPVNKDLLSGAASYFSQNKNNPSLRRDDFIFSLYGLAVLDSPQAARIGSFDDLSPDLLSLAVLTNHLQGETNPSLNGASKLISLAQTQGDTVFWSIGEKRNFGSELVSTSLAIRALNAVNADPDLLARGVKFLAANRRFSYWGNTYTTSLVMRALIDRFRRTGELTPDFNYTVSLNTAAVSQGKINSPSQFKNFEISPEKISAGENLVSVKKTGEGELYSTLTVKEFFDRPAPEIDHGLKITREYVDGNGVACGEQECTLAIGDLVTVNLHVEGLATEEYWAVITDELPAGLIPVNLNLKNEEFNRSRENYAGYSGITDFETTPNGVVLGIYRMSPGQNTYHYQARVICEGSFAVPPATVSLMYSPEIYGRTAAQVVKTGKGLSSGRPIAVKTPSSPDRFSFWPFLAGAAIFLGGGAFVFRKKPWFKNLFSRRSPPLPPTLQP